MGKWRKFIVFLTIFLLLAGYVSAAEAEMKISSPAFPHNGRIPAKYTCDGKNVSPPLFFEDVPEGAKSLALIMDDPDAPAGTWVHWVLWDINPSVKEIKEASLPAGGKEGINDFRKTRYGGPCPPSGTHGYFFKLYALDTTLDLKKDAKKSDLERAMHGHIISKAEVVGLYERK